MNCSAKEFLAYPVNAIAMRQQAKKPLIDMLDMLCPSVFFILNIFCNYSLILLSDLGTIARFGQHNLICIFSLINSFQFPVFKSSWGSVPRTKAMENGFLNNFRA